MPESDYDRALSLALKRLRARDRFTQEIRGLLEANDFSPSTVEEVLQFLSHRRILDDQRTILQTIERYSGKRSIGRNKIKAELIGRGAPEEVVDNILSSPEADEQEKMVAALQAKFKPGDSRVKGARFLLGRGFEEDHLEAVLDRFFGQN